MKMSDPRIIRCLILALLFGLLLTMIFRVKEGFQDGDTRLGSLDDGAGAFGKKTPVFTATKADAGTTKADDAGTIYADILTVSGVNTKAAGVNAKIAAKKPTAALPPPQVAGLIQ
jgi:hypothetical protein